MLKILDYNSFMLNMLTETYVNLFNSNEKSKYAPIVWDILQRTYEPFGGFKSAGSIEELIEDSWLWKLVKKNDKIIAVAIYKDKLGRKAIAKGSDGTEEGKNAIKKIYLEDIKIEDRRSWGEFSGAAEKLMLKYGGIKIPNTLVSSIINKELLELNPDEYHYTRLIAGEPHEKILIGNVDTNKIPSPNN